MTPEQALNPLQRLIRQRLRERGWSYREVARRGGMAHSTLYTLATTWNLARPPRPDIIDALARGLDVPVSAVRAAAAESTGMHYYDGTAPGDHDPDARERELLIASIDELTPQDRRHVAALVASLRQARGPAPDNTALDNPDNTALDNTAPGNTAPDTPAPDTPAPRSAAQTQQGHGLVR